MKTISICAQISVSNTPEYTTFSKKEGCLVYNGGFIYDDNNWLWLSGQSLELGEKVIDGRDRKYIIQRFDGNRFYTLKFPDFKGREPYGMDLIKGAKNEFIATFLFKNELKIYTLNTQTLLFTKIKDLAVKNIQATKVFKFHNNYFLFTSSTKNINLYFIDIKNNVFKNTYSKKITFSNVAYFSNFIDYEDFFLVDEDRSGTYLFNKNGTFISLLNKEDLNIKNFDFKQDIHLQYFFRFQDKYHIKFKNINEIYCFDNVKKEFFPSEFKGKKEVLNKSKSTTTNFTLNDKSNNLLQLQKKKNETLVTSYAQDFSITNTYQIPVATFPWKIISNNYKKELFGLEKGILYRFSFQKQQVTTFLEDKSIRGIVELSNEKILVSTDFSGWFTINLKTKKVTPFNITLNEENYIPSEGGELFLDENYFWTKNSKGILRVDRKTGKALNKVLYPITDIIQEKNTLFYGTYNYGLLAFDKKKLENKIIAETKEYDIQSLLKIEDSFYMSCIEGLLIYKDGVLSLKKPSNNTKEFEMISIYKNGKNTLLLGNRNGLLYEYNLVTKTFNLLYKDNLEASIATILIDNSKNIWLNTYKGYVKFNRQTKKYQRFSTEDGFSFFEANRYSSLKTKNGNFLVGTLKGLNYFNPNTISKIDRNAQLKFTSITYFDNKTGKEVTEQAPKSLNETKDIYLEPENRSLQLQFSLFDYYNNEDISYRYRLQKNQPWIDLYKKPEIQLLNLSADSYQLEIQALDTSNYQIGRALDFNIVVKEFFYKTFWFYGLLFLFFAGIIFWYYREQLEKNKIQQKLTQDIINAQEDERTRLALELHDSVGQQLMLLTRKSKSTNNNVLEELATDTLSNVRAISQGLYPVVLKRFGFTAAIEDLVNDIDENSSIFFTLEIENIDDILNEKKALHIYRMFQEILNNMLKYSETKSAMIGIKKWKHFITFTVEDFGKGFDYQKTLETSKSLGMKSLSERCKIINAQLSVATKLKKGTRITIILPHHNA